MSEVKISEVVERLERAYVSGMDEEFRDDLRVVLDAIPHPAELAEQQGDALTALVAKWRARQEEYDTQQSAESKKGYEVDWTPDARARSFETAADELEAALAATGKQQDGCTESNCRRRLTHPDHRGDIPHAGIGSTGKQQVGEVQGDGLHISGEDRAVLQRISGRPPARRWGKRSRTDRQQDRGPDRPARCSAGG